MIAKIRRFLTTRRALQSDTIDSLRRDVIRLHAAKLAAEKRADEADACFEYWCERTEVAEAELAAIKRQRSDNTRRGNATRKAKREAAALIVRTGCQQSIVQ